jgi:DNA-binding MarR family transcriptional regulator
MADNWLDENEQEAWRGLAAVMFLLPGALDRQLQADSGLTHAYYLILAMLSEAPERTLRMSQLADLTNTSQSRLSHAVSRLEERGWVERRQCPDDKRGQLAALTDAGMEAVAGTAPGHVAEVRRLVFDKLTRAQVHQLADITAALSAGLMDGRCPRAQSGR